MQRMLPTQTGWDVLCYCVAFFNAAYQYHLHGIPRKPFRTGLLADKREMNVN